jgi:N utilization substance protein B
MTEPSATDDTHGAPAEPHQRPRRAASRSAARLAAVQALFQIDSVGLDPHAAVEEFRAHRLGGADIDEGQPDLAHTDTKHFAAIVLGASIRAAEIDALIASVLPGDWSLYRIDPVIRALLRAGCFELLARDDVPVRVVADEYVSIANAFFEGVQTGFANAMLDALARRVRPEGFGAGHGPTPG